MKQPSEILFNESKQERSQKTLDNILQAAQQLVEEADPTVFTSRNLAKKSGYALGTLVHRLGSVENVFLWVIKEARNELSKKIALSITQLDTDITIQKFAEDMVDKGFTNFKKVGPKVMRFFEARITKREGLTADYFAYLDFFTEPYLEFSQKNKTDTFRKLSKNEAALLIRQLCLLAERPFMEGNPIAGTEEHRRIVVEAATRLLGK
jgi:hypothetical protein